LLLAAAETPGGEGWMAAAGSGFRDTSRVGASPPDMWQELVAANAGPTGQALEAVARRLQGWAEDLRAGRPLAGLEQAPAIRQRWEEAGHERT
ncbi:MAG: prephenate dehydrogenase/arogenate dehydrogenase family protein, partial [Firmicutes bacterium]|nr:prephenate dehydrogenase/arogenate dehydrogenase family protein [Bacillota bacterium]